MLDGRIGDVFEAIGSLFERSIEILPELQARWESFQEAIQAENLNEAAEQLGAAVESITSALRAATEACGGILELVSPLDADALIDSLEFVGGALTKAIEMADEIPLDRIVPIAGHLFAAAANFAAGNYVGGVMASLAALKGFMELYAEYGDALDVEVPDSWPHGDVLLPAYNDLEVGDYEALNREVAVRMGPEAADAIVLE